MVFFSCEMNLMSNKSFFTCNLLIQQKLSKLEFNQNTTFNSGMSKISLTPQLTSHFLALQLRRVLRRWPTFKLLCMCCTPFGSHSPFCSWALDAPFFSPHLRPTPSRVLNLREISIPRTGSWASMGQLL